MVSRQQLCAIFLLLALFATTITSAAKYSVTAQRVSNATVPLVNTAKPGASVFSFNYNPSYAALYDERGLPTTEALLVRVQDKTIPPYEYEVGPSAIAWVQSASNSALFNDLQNITLDYIGYDSVILDNSDGLEYENYGVEDPRVSYRPSDKLYYLFYTAAQAYWNAGYVAARLALATSATPNVKSSWIKHGMVLEGQKLAQDQQPNHNFKDTEAAELQYQKYARLRGEEYVLGSLNYLHAQNNGWRTSKKIRRDARLLTTEIKADISWSKSGAVIWRDELGELPVLLWGDTNIFFAVATNNTALQFVTFQPLIEPRSNYFDSFLVESGPPPLLLSDGNYFFIYNSARQGYPSVKPGWYLQYNPGYVVLDANNPTVILQRSDVPLLTPTLPWEIGTYDYAHLSPDTIFLEGAKPLGNDRFLTFFGCSDGSLGVATVTVRVLAKGKYAVEAEYE